MALTGVHACSNGYPHRNGECGFTPLSVRGVSMCQCGGYPATTVQGDCTVCGAGYYETMEEYRAAIPPVDSGRVEKEFPITITAYRGNKEVKVSGIREDSVRAKVDRDGNCNLSFEFADNPDRIGYLPCVDWYETECEA
ncbi:hypothetical protein SEA_EMMA1919_267 [Streptomyces phage Emma1919]|nr:hypothetical protein SEA_EMMA1919_267 [Streptomyces phage Emma1919]